MLCEENKHFDIDYLRYEMMGNSGRKCVCHLQGGNYEFKISVWINIQKIFEKVTS